MESNFQSNESLQFPYHNYGQVLYNINLINPTAVAPGANAFKYIEGGSWLNQIVFPVTREKFCEDVRQVCPSVKNNVFPFEPSDKVEFNHNQFIYTPSGCEFVKKIKDDREELDFSPVNVGNSLVDNNPDNYDLLEMEQAIAHKLEIDLTQLLQQQQDKIFLEHQRWQVIYQREIIFPNEVQKWYCDFSQQPLKMQKGRNSLANFFTYLTASGFYSLIKKTKGWDYLGLGGYHSNYNKIYKVTPLGLVLPHYIQFVDPFRMLFAEEDLEIIMRDVEIKISPDAISSDSKLASSTYKVSTEQKYYEVTIQPLTNSFGQKGKICDLQLGMEGKADIISREETVIKFLLGKARLITDL